MSETYGSTPSTPLLQNNRREQNFWQSREGLTTNHTGPSIALVIHYENEEDSYCSESETDWEGEPSICVPVLRVHSIWWTGPPPALLLFSVLDLLPFFLSLTKLEVTR